MTDQREDVRVYALFQHGKQALADGNARSAAEVLELAVEEEPEKGSLREALARAYFASERPAQARGEFERALELDPKDDYAHFGVGRCLEREGHLQRAAGHYKLACALADQPMYRRALERVEARLT